MRLLDRSQSLLNYLGFPFSGSDSSVWRPKVPLLLSRSTSKIPFWPELALQSVAKLDFLKRERQLGSQSQQPFNFYLKGPPCLIGSCCCPETALIVNNYASSGHTNLLPVKWIRCLGICPSPSPLFQYLPDCVSVLLSHSPRAKSWLVQDHQCLLGQP